MADETRAQRMELVVRTYIQRCNDADADAVAACFCPDAVHFFPVNERGLANWVGAAAIGANFAALVAATGRSWTVDQLVTDVDRHTTILEWTAFNRERDRLVRGVDWFDFEPQTLRIRSIRSFIATASSPDVQRVEQQDFDYVGRGYPTI